MMGLAPDSIAPKAIVGLGIARSVKRFPCKHKDLSLVPRIHGKVEYSSMCS